MAVFTEQIPEITEMSLGKTGLEEETDATPKSSSLKDNAPNSNGDEEHGLSRLEKIKTKFGDRPECFKNTIQEASFVFQATVATATTSFLSGVALIITVPVSRDLGMTQGEIAWISASTSLVAGAFQLAFGQLADLMGRKPMFITGMASFSAFVLLVAFAQNPFWMLIVCGILGACSAMVVPPAIGILGAAYATPSKRKNMAFSAFSAGNPLGFVFGTIVCGIATQLSSWRAAFIVLCIIWAILSVHAVWAVPNVENFDRAPFKERLASLKHFDYVGTILTIFGTGMFTAGLTLGPEDGWAKAHVIALLVVGIALLIIFALWERIFPTPLMPPHIWKDRNFSLIIGVVLLGTMSFTASAFWVAFFLQDLRKESTLMVAVYLLPMAIAGLFWNVVAGRILHRVNNTAIMVFGATCYVGSALLFSFMKEDSIYWAFIFPALILNVAGADLQFNVANMYVMQSLPKHQQSLAGGIFNVVIRLSNTAVMGISTAVYSSIELTPQGMADPMLKFTRTFQLCLAFAGASLLLAPFIRLGTQGNHPKDAQEPGQTEQSQSEKTTVVNVGADEVEPEEKKREI
ncbi:MFS general substrate transporter [Hypoxylon trugodes]|uniref:MFS general substrate transporter n=1 Tax=Hypoxylon trugodes TaxID=326681 RepID=UPI00219C2094|nr:MFS general substrate transporter [Hypoxylon trugodes]KAI1386471.1 MFS general substrate transporter [Hypoxylon trugodes]